jgi:hypothetical protein
MPVIVKIRNFKVSKKYTICKSRYILQFLGTFDVATYFATNFIIKLPSRIKRVQLRFCFKFFAVFVLNYFFCSEKLIPCQDALLFKNMHTLRVFVI